jgi:hypothetical protein
MSKRDWFYVPALVKKELGLEAIPLVQSARPDISALIKDPAHHYKELSLCDGDDPEDGVAQWAEELWRVVHGESEMEEAEEALEEVHKLPPLLKAFVATLVAAQRFESDWCQAGGQVIIEIEGNTDEDALVIETVIRAAEAAGLPFSFDPQD